MAFTFEEFPNSDFYNSDLRQILEYLRKLVDEVKVLDEWKKTHEAEYKELYQFYLDLINGNFSDDFIASLRTWLDNNLIDIVGSLIKTVWFGLSSEGYFMAVIPESWSDIEFGTIQNGELYGHLTLSYD